MSRKRITVNVYAERPDQVGLFLRSLALLCEHSWLRVSGPNGLNVHAHGIQGTIVVREEGNSDGNKAKE